jgi:hypothetical protein
MNPASLPTQPRELRDQVAVLQEALAQTRRENTILHQKLAALTRRSLGRKRSCVELAKLVTADHCAIRRGLLSAVEACLGGGSCRLFT